MGSFAKSIHIQYFCLRVNSSASEANRIKFNSSLSFYLTSYVSIVFTRLLADIKSTNCHMTSLLSVVTLLSCSPSSFVAISTMFMMAWYGKPLVELSSYLKMKGASLLG
jgi:hypothetical protein